MQRSILMACWAVSLSLGLATSASMADLLYVADDYGTSPDVPSSFEINLPDFDAPVVVTFSSTAKQAPGNDQTAFAMPTMTTGTGIENLGGTIDFRTAGSCQPASAMTVMPVGDLSVRSLNVVSSEFDHESELQLAAIQEGARAMHDAVRVKVKSSVRRKARPVSAQTFPLLPIADMMDIRGNR